MTKYRASFVVNAGNSNKGDLDFTDMNPDQMAEAIENDHPGVSVCHQCSNDIDDPEVGDLVAFNIDDDTYEQNAAGEWFKIGDLRDVDGD